MAVPSPVGFRIRAERKALGMTQAALAKQAGISPSYLNLIEANKREIGGALLKRIASLLSVESDALTGRAERRMISDLREIAFEPLVQHVNVSPDSATELVGRHPDWARTVLTLYRAWRDQTAIANALSDRLNQDPMLGDAVHQLLTHVTAIRSASEILDDVPEIDEERRQRFYEIISVEARRLSDTARSLASLFDQSGNLAQAVTPAEEVDDFLRQHNTWFPQLEGIGDRIRHAVARSGGPDEAALKDYLRARHGTTVAQVAGDGSQQGRYRNFASYDSRSNTISFLANATRSTRRFRLARQIVLLEEADAIEEVLDDPLLTGDAARDRARYALTSYVAGAVVLPYDDFLRSAVRCRYDVEILRQEFDASYEQVCHRLVTLRDPARAGVPFAFLRSDPAGQITKRFPLPGLPLVSHGHACPLWPIFTSFQTPDRTVRSLVEFPDGARFLMIAQAVTRQPASFHEAPFLQSVMLICDALHADQTVYADGLDLAAENTAAPVGPSCRMCRRVDCRFRGEGPILEAGTDVHRQRISPTSKA
jgi:predicted transcriptional regulator/transcriptional regulator with XRE-family HTH domain